MYLFRCVLSYCSIPWSFDFQRDHPSLVEYDDVGKTPWRIFRETPKNSPPGIEDGYIVRAPEEEAFAVEVLADCRLDVAFLDCRRFRVI